MVAGTRGKGCTEVGETLRLGGHLGWDEHGRGKDSGKASLIQVKHERSRKAQIEIVCQEISWDSYEVHLRGITE